MMDPKKLASTIDRHVAQRLRFARLQKGMSQESAAAVLGLTFQQLQKYEKGVNRVGPGRLAMLAHTYGKPAGWFYEDAPGIGDAPPAAVVPDIAVEIMGSRSGVRLARGFMAINIGQRAAVADLVASMAGHAAEEVRPCT